MSQKKTTVARSMTEHEEREVQRLHLRTGFSFDVLAQAEGYVKHGHTCTCDRENRRTVKRINHPLGYFKGGIIQHAPRCGWFKKIQED